MNLKRMTHQKIKRINEFYCYSTTYFFRNLLVDNIFFVTDITFTLDYIYYVNFDILI